MSIEAAGEGKKKSTPKKVDFTGRIGYNIPITHPLLNTGGIYEPNFLFGRKAGVGLRTAE